MIKSKNILFFCSFLFMACTALVDNEFLDCEPIPVVNGLLCADSIIKVQVSLSTHLADTTPDFVNDALVIIFNKIGIPDTLHYLSEGWYTSDKVAEIGECYTCKVNIPSFETLSAQTTISEVTKVDSVIYTHVARRGEEGEKISSFSFCISNDVDKLKYWEIKMKSRGYRRIYNNETNDFERTLATLESDIFMEVGHDSVLLNEANPLTIFSNIKMKGEHYCTKFYFSEYGFRYRGTDTLYIELRSIDESYYRYQKQYYIYDSSSWGGIGSSPQRYPLFSNVVNGLGLFTGVSITRKVIDFQ